ncbi:MAG: rhomboid family protein [Stackebrandtia sp.]
MAASRISAAVLVVLLTLFMWVLEIIDYTLDGALDRYGIVARNPDYFAEILSAPFLHYGFPHLMANSVPLLILGFLVAMSGFGRFLSASLIIIVTSGAGVWLFAPANTVTLGASGLVFGYFGYLLARGFVERRPADLAITVVVAIAYGTMIFGVLPNDPTVSWQGHLFGFVGGILAAIVLPRRTVPRPSPAY